MTKYYLITPKLYFKTLRGIKKNTDLKIQTKLAQNNNMELKIGISDSLVEKIVDKVSYNILINGCYYKLQEIAKESGLPLSLILIIIKKDLGDVI